MSTQNIIPFDTTYIGLFNEQQREVIAAALACYAHEGLNFECDKHGNNVAEGLIDSLDNADALSTVGINVLIPSNYVPLKKY